MFNIVVVIDVTGKFVRGVVILKADNFDFWNKLETGRISSMLELKRVVGTLPWLGRVFMSLLPKVL